MSAAPPKPDLDGPDSKVREGPEPGGLRLNVAVGREAVLDHSRRAEFGRPRPQPRRAPGGRCAASRLATRSSPPDRQRPTGDTGDGAPPPGGRGGVAGRGGREPFRGKGDAPRGTRAHSGRERRPAGSMRMVPEEEPAFRAVPAFRAFRSGGAGAEHVGTLERWNAGTAAGAFAP